MAWSAIMGFAAKYPRDYKRILDGYAKQNPQNKEDKKMEQEKILAYLEKDAPMVDKIEWVHIVDAGRITLESIDKIETRNFEVQENNSGQIKSVMRFFLTLRDQPKQVLVPKSVMKQLYTVMQENKITHFKVMKSGSGITTKYMLLPNA